MRHRSRPSTAASCRLLAGLLVVSALAPGAAEAQHRLVSPSGDTISFPADSLRRMLDRTRALYADLEEDPRVGYFIDFGEPVDESLPARAYPWNAVEVQSDSVASITVPGNLREADRAYYNYAVRRMRVVRTMDPDVSCDSLVTLEAGVVESFAEGWIVARTLFGGPPFAPLDEIAFARERGLLAPLIAIFRDRHIGACAGEWAEQNAGRVTAYLEWRESTFPGPIPSLREEEGEPEEKEPPPELLFPPRSRLERQGDEGKR